MRIIIAGGGTGGHLFPGIAIAQKFVSKNPETGILFVGAGNSFEKTTVAKAGFNHKRITVEGIKGRGITKQLISAFKIPKGMFESLTILKSFKPNLVFGVGSYSSGPIIFMAWLLGIKIALHEQNILPGITNRMLSRFADRIYISFEKTIKLAQAKKIIFSGNPLRKEITDIAKKNIADYGHNKSTFNILIIGGSQGAHSINMAIIEALSYIKNKESLFFVHQTGSLDEETVAKAYEQNKTNGDVKPFFDDMAIKYSQADLIICRAGATTVAEITVIGRGAIYIPYPYAANDHQTQNAQALCDAGAAEMIAEKDLSGKILAEKIEYFSENPKELYKMATLSKTFGMPDAAAVIVNDCYQMLDPNGGNKHV
ncbi:MAG: undecaprenyldiphospho-muramoylpentapeptide beta-N-acetylglucosaminyltransferase [Pseudomonadota bacterium]